MSQIGEVLILIKYWYYIHSSDNFSFIYYCLNLQERVLSKNKNITQLYNVRFVRIYRLLFPSMIISSFQAKATEPPLQYLIYHHLIKTVVFKCSSVPQPNMEFDSIPLITWQLLFWVSCMRGAVPFQHLNIRRSHRSIDAGNSMSFSL